MLSEVVEVNNKPDIGLAILSWQAKLAPSESISLRFVDGGTWVGSCVITAADDADDLTFTVAGSIFAGELSVPFKFIGEPDGPADWPIRHNGRTFTSEDETESDAIKRAAFYASGATFSPENAPMIKGSTPNASAKIGEKLASVAAAVESNWAKASGAKLPDPNAKKAGVLRWYSAGELLSKEPETGVWPRPMPRPVIPMSSLKIRKPADASETVETAPAPTVVEPAKRYVHKRAARQATSA